MLWDHETASLVSSSAISETNFPPKTINGRGLTLSRECWDGPFHPLRSIQHTLLASRGAAGSFPLSDWVILLWRGRDNIHQHPD